jgi:hypothetical protein
MTEALATWKTLLAGRQFSTDLLWLFDENLCFEPGGSPAESFKLGIQTQFTPPPAGAEQIAYDYFCEFEARVVFYRLGSFQGKSACVLLCDEWFEGKTEKEGFTRRDDWLLAFYPGTGGELEGITDEVRWRKRVLKERPLHDLDFVMTLRAVHEILAHGRVLTSYEHYALRFLHGWRRFMGEPQK